MFSESKEKNAFNVYQKFLSELHNKEMWTDGFEFFNSERKSYSSLAVSPELMTKEKAYIKDIWWYDKLISVFLLGKELGVIEDLIIHGSFGDFSNTKFSDLEITVLLNEEVFTDIDKKRNFSTWVEKYLNQFIVQVDPLQHHGAFFVWKRLLSHYSDLIIPACVYRTCWSLTGQSLHFNLVDSIQKVSAISSSRLKSTLYSVAKPRRSFFRFGYNDYSIKRYMSNIMLVPAFYYQSKGYVIDKPKSISLFLEEHPGFFSDAIIMATNLRDEWPESSKLLKYTRPRVIFDKIPQGKLDILLLSFFTHKNLVSNFKSSLLPAATKGAIQLLEGLDENI